MGGKPKEIIDDVVDFTTDTVKGGVDFVVDLGKKAVKLITSPFTGGFDIPDIGGYGNLEDQQIESSTTVDFKPSNKGIPIVYGKYVERAVIPVFVATGGDKNQYLYMAGVIGQGLSQDDTYGSRLWNMKIDNSVVDITTASVSGNTSVYGSTGSVALSSSAVRSSPYPRFGGRNGTQPGVYTVVTGKYKNRLKFQCFDGSDTQPASSLLKEHPLWNDEHRLRGQQYIALRFEWNNEEIQDSDGNNLANPYSSLPAVVVMAPGKNVPMLSKPTTQSPGYSVANPTNFNNILVSNTYQNGDGAVIENGYEPSGNTINNMIDYMLNNRFGLNLNISKIDQDSFTNASICNSRTQEINPTATSLFGINLQQLLSVLNSIQGSYAQVKILRNIGESNNNNNSAEEIFLDNTPYYRQFLINPENKYLDNINRMLTSIGAQMPYVNGAFKVVMETGGDPANPFNLIADATLKDSNAFVFNDDNIVEGLQVMGGKLDTTFNQIKVDFTDLANNSETNSVVYPVDGSDLRQAYLRADNNQTLTAEVTNAGITNEYHATQYARVLLRKSRNQQTVQFRTLESASNLIPGDLIRVNSSVLQIDDMYRITDIILSPTGEVEITAVYHDSQNYDYTEDDGLLDALRAVLRPQVIQTAPNVFSAPEALILFNKIPITQDIESTESDLIVKWRDRNLNAGANRYEVQAKRNLENDDNFVTLGETFNQQFVIPTRLFDVGTTINVRVRTISPQGTKSAFANTTGTNRPFYGGFFKDSKIPSFNAADGRGVISSGNSSSVNLIEENTVAPDRNTGEL